jgi:peptidoglycan/xylan/chitin deacetylase (PgdA/CDA1 family)
MPRIPILMYHSISDSNDSNRHPYYRTVTTPRVFEQHMKFLRDDGYQTIGLSEAVQRLKGPTEAAEKKVAITFDDGFEDFYSNAFPVLSKYRQSATMFLPTAYIGHQARKFKTTECLTWKQVRELQEAGMQFGSHTVTHPQLRTLDTRDVEDEVRRSKDEIENELGSPVTSFSYPYAFPEADSAFTQRLGTILEETGYENGVSTIIGKAKAAKGRFFMSRLPANSSDDIPLFSAKLNGGYDWLHMLQLGSKFRPSPSRIRGTSATTTPANREGPL